MFGRKIPGEDFDNRMRELRQQKELFDKETELREVRRSMRRWHPPTTTKIIMAFLLINCTAVEVYSMVAMYRLQNLDSLYALITAVITESISFAVYCCKAYNETKQEELIRLERDKMENAADMEEEEDDFNPEEALG